MGLAIPVVYTTPAGQVSLKGGVTKAPSEPDPYIEVEVEREAYFSLLLIIRL